MEFRANAPVAAGNLSRPDPHDGGLMSASGIGHRFGTGIRIGRATDASFAPTELRSVDASEVSL